MILSRNFGRRVSRVTFYFFVAVIVFWICPAGLQGHDEITLPLHHKLLKNIHDEVLDFGLNEDPNLIKREFWMDLDGVESNKEEHVVVMRHNDGLRFRMTVQVTYFSEDKGRRFVRFAKNTKSIQCCLIEDGIEISDSDYTPKEMEGLFQNILAGIRNKKELLKLIKH
jgi:hypothetical protein